MSTDFMAQAIELAVENVRRGGGPFAAIVVKDGAIVATGVNRVTATNDPTAHAEVTAIRAACAALGQFQLTGCDLYTSCEPCPMCLGAIYWARPARVFYGATADDAAAAGFDDSFIYAQIALPHAARAIPMQRADEAEATRPFQVWQAATAKTPY
jgi:guanine deaminase